MPKQTTSPSDYPQAVLQQIEQLAQHIVIARKRRGETQAQWARKLGISQPTMARIERGDPSVAMASYVMCLWLINQAEGLADLIAPQADRAALERELGKVRATARRRTAPAPGQPSRTAPWQPVHQAAGAVVPVATPEAAKPASPQIAEAAQPYGRGRPPNETAAGLAALIGSSQAKRR